MVAPVTSGSASFLVSRDDICKAAMRGLTQLSIGETIQSEDTTNLAFALNMLLKELSTEGYLPWLYQTLSFALTAGKLSYTIAESGADVTAYRPLRVVAGWRGDNSTPVNNIPMTPLSRQAWDDTTPKVTPGYPNSFYYDPQIVAGVYYPWPQPTDATQTAYILSQRPVQDILSSGQNFDLPQEWYRTLKWMLMDEVATDFELDLPTVQYIAMRAKSFRDKLGDFSREEAPVSFAPDQQMGWGGGGFIV